MPYHLKLSYQTALNGRYKERWSYGPDYLGAYFAERGATVIHNSIYLPKIDFTNGKHIDNVIHLFSAARDMGYDEAIIELDDSESRTIFLEHFKHQSTLPGIFIRIQEDNAKTIIRAQLFKGVSSIFDTELLSLSEEELDNMFNDAKERLKSRESNTNVYDGFDEEAKIRLREIENSFNETSDAKFKK